MKACFLLTLLLPYSLIAQVYLKNEGAYLETTTSTVLVVKGHVQNTNDATLKNNGVLELTHDFNQTGSGTNYNGTGELYFKGTTNQNISSVSTLVISKLTVENGHILILGTHVQIANSLDLNNDASLQLGDYDLSLNSGASITNYDNTHYIQTNGTGDLIQEVSSSNVLFPIGNTSYNPVTMSNAGTTDNFKIRVEDELKESYPSGMAITSGGVNRTWQVEEGTTGGSNVALIFQWQESEELGTFNRTESAIAHWGGASWDIASYTGATNLSGSTWTQTRTGITSFSPFGVVDKTLGESLIALPIELLSFTAERNLGEWVQLNWQTLSESDNAGFEIEVSTDAIHFEKVSFVEGQGNSTVLNTYFFNHLQPNAAYYRLKQVDFSDTYSYSPIRFVEGLENNLELSIYPNPTQKTVVLLIQKQENSDLILKVSDAKGSILLEVKGDLETINQILNQNLKYWENGIYILKLMTPNQVFEDKLLLMK